MAGQSKVGLIITNMSFYPYFIPVARHQSKEIPKGTFNKMMKQAGIKK